MRKVLAAALAVLTFGAIADRAKAGPIEAFRKVAAGYDAFDNVRRCQFFDPGAGEWVEFWVPGSCLSYRAPAYGYDGRSHYDRRYVRHRAYSRRSAR
jgi:hypothetical protein